MSSSNMGGVKLITVHNPRNWNTLHKTAPSITLSKIGFDSPFDTIHIIGAPKNAYTYGTLFTISLTTEDNYYYNIQFYMPHKAINKDDMYNKLFYRTMGDGYGGSSNEKNHYWFAIKDTNTFETVMN